jgi:hypothetical protein
MNFSMIGQGKGDLKHQNVIKIIINEIALSLSKNVPGIPHYLCFTCCLLNVDYKKSRPINLGYVLEIKKTNGI